MATRREEPEPVLRLPDDPSVEQLGDQARELRDGIRSGDPVATELVRAVDGWSAGEPPTDPSSFGLAAAQRVLARAHGFPGWPRLLAHLDVLAHWRWDPEPADPPAADPHDALLSLACLRYDSADSPARWARAAALLAEHPELPERSAWAAAVASDPRALRGHLAADPGAATAVGGPQRWDPLLFLTYSRLGHPGPDQPGADGAAVDDVLTCARLLLGAGADPDTGRLWSALSTPFTALTGCFGEGEQGPVKQPRHHHSRELATELLAAGADPDDGQTLYNRMFRPDDDHLELLLSHGLGADRPGLRRPWRLRLGSTLESPARMLDRQLDWAVTHGMVRRVGLLLGSRVLDPARPLRPDGRTAADLAAAGGLSEISALLTDAGVGSRPLRPVEDLVAAACAADRARVDRLLGAHPELAGSARREQPDAVVRAVTAGRLAGLPLLAGLGFDVDARVEGRTALHDAAWDGSEAAVRALLAVGADPAVRDARFGATPRGWAEHAGQRATAALLPPDLDDR